ncbi:alpha/beta fold hydrolase [Limnobacter litoralis]|uniref:Lipase n=1 Tax=Limnobacter litoralis TaxID=481366 RepID=A0ABQ5YQY4_9BURK|nr:alpha/beta hydrolase [Limnobacter litoralis]GLR25851.1 lipase [Limnobacter litoralis]
MNWFEKILMRVYGWVTRRLISARYKQLGLKELRLQRPEGGWSYVTGGQGPALILVHGFGANKENWLAVAPRLMKTHTVYIPDLIGFGESDKPTQVSYTVSAQSERLIGFADALGISQFHVGGNSMGGYISGVLAGLYPERVLSAWMLNPAGVQGAEPSEVAKAFLEQGRLVLVPENYGQYQNIVQMCFSGEPPAMPGFMRKYFGWVNVMNRDLLKQVFYDFTNPEANPTLNDMVTKARARMLLVWGDQDRLVDVSGLQVLKQVNPAIQTQLLENTGHCPMVDRPKQVLEAYLAFQAAA